MSKVKVNRHILKKLDNSITGYLCYYGFSVMVGSINSPIQSEHVQYMINDSWGVNFAIHVLQTTRAPSKLNVFVL